MNSTEMVLLHTGGEVIIARLKSELEMKGIFCIVKDGFRQGIEAGFGGGVPSAIDIFVRESDFEKANNILTAITE